MCNNDSFVCIRQICACGRRDTQQARQLMARDRGPAHGHQDAPHHLRCHAKKLGPVLPRDAVLCDQPEVDLLHERRRLQGMPDSFPPQMASRPPAQLLIH